MKEGRTSIPGFRCGVSYGHPLQWARWSRNLSPAQRCTDVQRNRRWIWRWGRSPSNDRPCPCGWVATDWRGTAELPARAGISGAGLATDISEAIPAGDSGPLRLPIDWRTDGEVPTVGHREHSQLGSHQGEDLGSGSTYG
jgi:hypothetical protein